MDAYADCVGTGALIGSCHVITAGHVIFNWDPRCGNLGWADKVIFVPGLYTDGSGVVRWPFGSQYATSLTSFQGWTQSQDEDHDMGLVLTICDRITVLEFGQVIASGPPDEVRRDPRVVTAYLGGTAAASATATTAEAKTA